MLVTGGSGGRSTGRRMPIHGFANPISARTRDAVRLGRRWLLLRQRRARPIQPPEPAARVEQRDAVDAAGSSPIGRVPGATGILAA
jgi:hypothetical protein